MMRAGKDYGVRVITAYENKRVGQVIYPPGLLRDALVRTGRVERIKPPAESLLDGMSDQAESAEQKTSRKRKQVRT